MSSNSSESRPRTHKRRRLWLPLPRSSTDWQRFGPEATRWWPALVPSSGAVGFELDERSVMNAERLTQPVLVLNGELDWNLPPTEATAWKQRFAEVGADAKVVTFPCVTHALNCVEETNPALMTPADMGRSIAPQVIEELIDFFASEQGK